MGRLPLSYGPLVLAYGAVALAHRHAYLSWNDDCAHRVYMLHAASITGHVASIALCACGHQSLGAATILAVNLCHNWLIHLWNTVLASTAFMSRLRLQGVNDLTCTLALSFCALYGCRLRQTSVRIAVAILLVVHASLFFGQALKIPGLDWLVVNFYPETVVREGGPLHSCFNLFRWLAVQSDISSSTFLMVMIMRAESGAKKRS